MALKIADLSVEDLKTSEAWRVARIQAEFIDDNDMQFLHLVDNAENVLPIIQNH